MWLIKQHRCKANRQLEPQQTHLFNGLLSGTTQVSRYKKGKTNLDCTEARDSEWQWHQMGHMQVCTSLQTHNQCQNPTTQFFLQARCPSCHPTNSVKALKAATWLRKKTVNIWALYSQPHWYFNFCTTGHKICMQCSQQYTIAMTSDCTDQCISLRLPGRLFLFVVSGSRRLFVTTPPKSYATTRSNDTNPASALHRSNDSDLLHYWHYPKIPLIFRRSAW